MTQVANNSVSNLSTLFSGFYTLVQRLGNRRWPIRAAAHVSEQAVTPLLERVMINLESRISTLPLLTAAEREQLLIKWNPTHPAYPSDQYLQHLVEAQVARTPDAVAILWEDQHLTYQELNDR